MPTEPPDPPEEEEEGPDDLPPDNLIQLRSVARLPSADPPPDPDLVEADDGPLEAPPPHLLPAAVEALLFAADGPVTVSQLEQWLGGPGAAAVVGCLHELSDRLRRQQGGVRLLEIAKGWQLRTDVRFATWVAAMRGGKPVRLSKAALETLSILAYRQPATKSEIEELRGVDSGGVLRMLCERDLATVVGRKEEPGRPLIYGTTPTFLSLFNLRDLSDLPTLRDLRELQRDDPRAGAVVPTQLELPLDEDEILDEDEGTSEVDFFPSEE